MYCTLKKNKLKAKKKKEKKKKHCFYRVLTILYAFLRFETKHLSVQRIEMKGENPWPGKEEERKERKKERKTSIINSQPPPNARRFLKTLPTLVGSLY